MRYILAITGLLVAVVIAVGVWVFLLRGEGGSAAGPAPTLVAVQAGAASPAQPAGELAAEGGEGSLRVCNETANQVSIALGYKAPRGWQSEGWWAAGPRECKTVFNGRLDARYYYIFAADDVGGGVWDGTNFMCTRDDTFTIFGVEDCLARGHERTGFFEVDTQNKTNWTLQLIDGEVVSGESSGTDDTLPLEGDLHGDDGIEADDTPTDEGAASE